MAKDYVGDNQPKGVNEYSLRSSCSPLYLISYRYDFIIQPSDPWVIAVRTRGNGKVV